MFSIPGLVSVDELVNSNMKIYLMMLAVLVVCTELYPASYHHIHVECAQSDQSEQLLLVSISDWTRISVATFLLVNFQIGPR